MLLLSAAKERATESAFVGDLHTVFEVPGNVGILFHEFQARLPEVHSDSPLTDLLGATEGRAGERGRIVFSAYLVCCFLHVFLNQCL